MAQHPGKVLQVKRKRDDAPVDSLYLDPSSKRIRSSPAPYYFKRLPSAPAGRAASKSKSKPEEKRKPIAVPRAGRIPGIWSGGKEHKTGNRRDSSEDDEQDAHGPSAGLGVDSSDKVADDGPRARHVVLKTDAENGRRYEFAPEDDDRMNLDGAVGDDDYVYDTYVRAPIDTGGSGNDEEPDKAGALSGQLVVSDADQQWLDNYFWDGQAGNDEDAQPYTDDEDSNAEDYYGADYPEEEEYEYDSDGEPYERYDDNSDNEGAGRAGDYHGDEYVPDYYVDDE